jgi:hypothetical protein
MPVARRFQIAALFGQDPQLRFAVRNVNRCESRAWADIEALLNQRRRAANAAREAR